MEANPWHAPTHLECGRICEKRNEIDTAKRHFEDAIRLDAGLTEAMVELGILLIVFEDNWEQGRGWIEHAMRAKPEDDHPHAVMATLHAERREAKEAVERHAHAVALNPARGPRTAPTSS